MTIKSNSDLLRADAIVELRLNQMFDDLYMYFNTVMGFTNAEIADLIADRYDYADLSNEYLAWAESGEEDG